MCGRKGGVDEARQSAEVQPCRGAKAGIRWLADFGSGFEKLWRRGGLRSPETGGQEEADGARRAGVFGSRSLVSVLGRSVCSALLPLIDRRRHRVVGLGRGEHVLAGRGGAGRGLLKGRGDTSYQPTRVPRRGCEEVLWAWAWFPRQI